MGKKGQNEVWIMWILKSLLAAYVEFFGSLGDIAGFGYFVKDLVL